MAETEWESEDGCDVSKTGVVIVGWSPMLVQEDNSSTGREDKMT